MSKEIFKAINDINSAVKNLENSFLHVKENVENCLSEKQAALEKKFADIESKLESSISSKLTEVDTTKCDEAVAECKQALEELKQSSTATTAVVSTGGEDYIPCRVWDYKAEYNECMRKLEEQYHKDLEDATKSRKDVEKAYQNDKEAIQKFYDKAILKEDETAPGYINPSRISNYQGRYVQLAIDKDGFPHKNDDGTFKVILAKGPNALVLGVCDGMHDGILHVYDSGFHNVTTAGLNKIEVGGFICPAKNKRGEVSYVHEGGGAIDDIDKFRIPLGKIITVSTDTENPTSMLCKLCD